MDVSWPMEWVLARRYDLIDIAKACATLTNPAPMHISHVDIIKTRPRGWQNDNPKMRYCLSVQLGRELGKRARYVLTLGY